MSVEGSQMAQECAVAYVGSIGDVDAFGSLGNKQSVTDPQRIDVFSRSAPTYHDDG